MPFGPNAKIVGWILVEEETISLQLLSLFLFSELSIVLHHYDFFFAIKSQERSFETIKIQLRPEAYWFNKPKSNF